jgi:hypothetical protein
MIDYNKGESPPGMGNLSQFRLSYLDRLDYLLPITLKLFAFPIVLTMSIADEDYSRKLPVQTKLYTVKVLLFADTNFRGFYKIH